jgi:pimeloyl-ACP methyl ester carboxylesterase
LHGWTGSHRIWENLPLQLTNKHQNIVCFGLDVNGFGQSPFMGDTPSEELCNPPALMAAVELWMVATNLWPGPFFRKHKPFYLFVGHSMSGAALFYKNNTDWQDEAFGAYALAPALFCNDAQRQTFFKTVGASIGLPSFTPVKNALAPHAIALTGPGASPQVKNEHLRIFNQTPFGTLAQTLYALGSTAPLPEHTDWARYKVALGKKDMLVSANNVLNLLSSLKFKSSQIRVTPGDHYFFSYGKGSPINHQLNRQAVFDDLLTYCHKLSAEAKTI